MDEKYHLIGSGTLAGDLECITIWTPGQMVCNGCNLEGPFGYKNCCLTSELYYFVKF